MPIFEIKLTLSQVPAHKRVVCVSRDVLDRAVATLNRAIRAAVAGGASQPSAVFDHFEMSDLSILNGPY